MVKQLKQNGCRTACQAAQPEGLALKEQLGGLGLGDRGSASRNRPCWPTGGDPAWYLSNVGKVRKSGLTIRSFEQLV